MKLVYLSSYKKISLSSTYLFSEKQEDLEHCCDILRNELKLFFTLEGILTLFIHIANDTKKKWLLSTIVSPNR